MLQCTHQSGRGPNHSPILLSWEWMYTTVILHQHRVKQTFCRYHHWKPPNIQCSFQNFLQYFMCVQLQLWTSCYTFIKYPSLVWDHPCFSGEMNYNSTCVSQLLCHSKIDSKRKSWNLSNLTGFDFVFVVGCSEWRRMEDEQHPQDHGQCQPQQDEGDLLRLQRVLQQRGPGV